MKRTTPILYVALGPILFGTAVGLVYIDDRAIRIRELDLLERKLVLSPSAAAEPLPPAQPVSKVPPIGAPVMTAMAIGPLGAALGLAGFLMLLFELPWLRRADASQAAART